MNPTLALRFWGKSDRDDPSNYHPLLFHLLDVGNAARALWHYVLPNTIQQRIAKSLDMSPIEAEILVVLLVAQHDLGKASAFQTKVDLLWKPMAEFSEGVMADGDKAHGLVTFKVLPKLATLGVGGWKAEPDVAYLLSQITAGHHGQFPTASDIRGMGRMTVGQTLWDESRKELLTELCQHIFGEIDSVNCSLTVLDDPALVPILGGLVSVADWIGSSKRHFPPAGPTDSSQYAVLSKQQAEKALGDFGWMPRPIFTSSKVFADLFPFTPNRMQEKVAQLADTATHPYLLIVEAAMGQGKTEAALYAVDRALTTGLAHGFYLALPTQATGNAMFQRVLTDYLGTRGFLYINLQLLHAGSELNELFEQLQLAAIGERDEGTVVAESWFTPKKQALLAPFGVGTIDQSLLSVLQTNHWFVRLFGLAGKVIVFDEVHAYDVYMSELLKRLISWLRVLGCTVVLLSATLPVGKRKELISAWDSDAVPPNSEYPRVTYVGGGNCTAEFVGSTTPQSKAIAFEFTRLDFAELLDRMKTDLSSGGCAVVICNTVGRAQEAYRLFHSTLSEEGWEVTLFHARTIAKWRRKREDKTLDAFGKPKPGRVRPPKAVLIATQVVEQSLDLDFDWMASEMAPVDLLLQRVGRLWRHDRQGLRPLTKPQLLVLCEKQGNGLPDFPPFATLIYDEYVLLRSYRALEGKETLVLPSDIEPLIQVTYDLELSTEDLSDSWKAALVQAEASAEEKRDEDKKTAEAALVLSPHHSPAEILEPGSTLDSVRQNLLDEDDPRIHKTVRAATRLGDPSISLVCLGTDADGKPLVSLPKGTPTKTQAKELARYALSVSQKGVYYALKDMNPPKGWEDCAPLRYHRALELENGRRSLAGYTLTLSETLGLVIEKEGKKAEK
jgi:CRISPR-associated endonuclease/helicase Cas3